jgi:hypothetical protein
VAVASRQVAVEQRVELAADLTGQPWAVGLGGVVQPEQQPPGLAVDHGHRVAAVHGHLVQSFGELAIRTVTNPRSCQAHDPNRR